ncbi:hypothetical protein [uncultured Amphritea sp.]|uniref:hypothetical protein n=1 Tax=uncultured Amphritea sp. TaxID=981605 RepID=UPI00260CE0C4|nr:hypothetical protein [uncultured Amphritea sp.]
MMTLVKGNTQVYDVCMVDVVGDYDTPDEVTEWEWVEEKASYKHTQNGSHGIWEFLLNVSVIENESNDNDIPERLKPVIQNALEQNCSYILFHQGT